MIAATDQTVVGWLLLPAELLPAELLSVVSSPKVPALSKLDPILERESEG